MAFGFSVGDFVTVTKIIVDISLSLRDVGGSASEYQELLREFGGLQQALGSVEKLKAIPDLQPAIDQIKCVALACRIPLTDFLSSIRKYEESLGTGKSRGRLLDWRYKAQWSFRQNDLVKLQGYLNVHVGTINAMLLAHGLEVMHIAAETSQANQNNLQTKLDLIYTTGLDVRKETVEQRAILEENRWFLTQVGHSPLAILWDALTTVRLIFQINYTLRQSQTSLPQPDLRHTWFQAPVILEDILGHTLPIPSEFDYELVTAIIKVRFKKGQCWRLVMGNNYELFNVKMATSQITEEDWTWFLPGSSIKMAALVETRFSSEKRCPMPNCASQAFYELAGGEKEW